MGQAQFWDDWLNRGIIQQATNPELGQWIASRLARNEKLYVYCGFDPTAESLHIGSLMPVIGLRRLKLAGLNPIALVGGATGMIGDPSGKSAERNLLDAEALERNTAGLAKQLEQLLGGQVGKDFLLLNNADWAAKVTFLDFLRDIGKHFSVNMMVHKESVRARMEDHERGISYTEFSYMLLQAFDFLHLFQTYGCRLQVGGNDQWGNITAGIDLIHHKHHGEEVHGFTFPLITTASGQKFGKSERGNIWLDANRTHPYFMYKYFFDSADDDVVKYLNYLTFLPLEQIEELAEKVATQPHLREAQRVLAVEVTGFVHGCDTALACQGLEAAMHADDVDEFEKHATALRLMDPSHFEAQPDSDLPVVHKPLSSLQGEGLSAVDLAVEVGLFQSKSEVRREINSKNSGFRVGGQQVTDADFRITADLLGSRRVLQIRKGKKNKRMVCFHES